MSAAETSDERESEHAETDEAEDHDAAPAARGCWACQVELKGQYYEVDAHPICASCAARVKNPESEGTPFGRFARAVIYGSGAGVVGASVYYAIRAITDYEFGLIAIAVGFMVGYAVKTGSYGRGGWRYQLIAMAITYVAIVTTYVPIIVEGFEQELALEPANHDDASLAGTAEADAAEGIPASEGTLPPSATVSVSNPGDAVAAEPVGIVHWLLAIVIALNHRPKVQVDGPFALAPSAG